MMNIFSCICWLSVCLLWRNVCSCLLPIFNWIIWGFLMLSCISYYVFWILTLYQVISFANIFSYSVGCLLVLLIFFLHCAKPFNFDVVPIVYFRFCFPCLRRYIKKEVTMANVREITARVLF